MLGSGLCLRDKGSSSGWVWQGSECYRLEIMLHDVLDTVRCSLADGDADALVLKV